MLKGLELQRNIGKFLLKHFVLEHFNDFKIQDSVNKLIGIFSPLISKFSLFFFALTSLKIYSSYSCLSIKLSFCFCSSSLLSLFLYLFVQSGIILTLFGTFLGLFLFSLCRNPSEQLLIQILLLLLLLDLEFLLSLFALLLFLSFFFHALFLLSTQDIFPNRRTLNKLYILLHHIFSPLLGNRPTVALVFAT